MPIGESIREAEPASLEKPVNPFAGMSRQELAREYGLWHRDVYLKQPGMPADAAAKRFAHQSGLTKAVIEILQDPERLDREISNEAAMAKEFLQYYISQERPKEKEIGAQAA